MLGVVQILSHSYNSCYPSELCAGACTILLTGSGADNIDVHAQLLNLTKQPCSFLRLIRGKHSRLLKPPERQTNQLVHDRLHTYLHLVWSLLTWILSSLPYSARSHFPLTFVDVFVLATGSLYMCACCTSNVFVCVLKFSQLSYVFRTIWNPLHSRQHVWTTR